MTVRDHIARRSTFDESKDFIPTPGYATRVLFELVMPELKEAEGTIWDPSAGAGHMCRVFEEYRCPPLVHGTDLYDPKDMGYTRQDFTKYKGGKTEAIITNPPYKHAVPFIKQGLKYSTRFLCLLMRVQVLEGQKRFEQIFNVTPPTQVAIFSDRIPFKTGKTVRKAPKMFTHIWICWDKEAPGPRPLMWIPPHVQAHFEMAEDYDESK